MSTFSVQRARVLRPGGRPGRSRDDHRQPRRRDQHPRVRRLRDERRDRDVAGSDYTAAAGTLNFAAGETTKTFDVDVANDGAAEANETVNLTLTSGATTVDTSLLSIVDNDNPKASVQLSSPVYDVNEADGTATVTVTLSHAVDADVTVDYATADGTAVAGSDYTDTHGTLTFSGNVNNGGTGETSKTIQIPITQDPDAEDPETLTLTLSNALPGASSILGAPATGDGHDRRRRPGRPDRLQVAALRRR